MRANHVALVDGEQVADLVDRLAEMVGPELDHPLIQLPLRERAAVDRRLLQLVLHRPGVRAEQDVGGLAHQRIPRGDGGFERAVVDARVIELVVEVSLPTHRGRALQFALGHAERHASHEPRRSSVPLLERRDGFLRNHLGESVLRLSVDGTLALLSRLSARSLWKQRGRGQGAEEHERSARPSRVDRFGLVVPSVRQGCVGSSGPNGHGFIGDRRSHAETLVSEMQNRVRRVLAPLQRMSRRC